MKTKITSHLLFLFVLLCSLKLFSQEDSLKQASPTDKRYIIWASPSKATHVYGLMFNIWPKDSMPYPKINGVEFNICPATVFSPFILAVFSLDVGRILNMNSDSLPLNALKNFKKINGLQLGFMNQEPTVINGLDINASGSFESVTNGLTLSAIRNEHYVINGITVAAMENLDHTCNGVQIALLNSCKQLKGFQFGLWNKNQKRSLPLMNWCFKQSYKS